MEEKRVIEDLVKLMNGQYDMNDYLSEIKAAVSKVTQDKILNGLKDTVNIYKTNSTEDANKEVALLNAIKPFIDENQRNNIDVMTNMISNFRAMGRLMQDIKQVSVTSQESTIDKRNNTNNNNVKVSRDELIEEKNTVYEIDQECERRINTTGFGNNFLPLLLIMLTGF